VTDVTVLRISRFARPPPTSTNIQTARAWASRMQFDLRQGREMVFNEPPRTATV
jgi:hypothetical protein